MIVSLPQQRFTVLCFFIQIDATAYVIKETITQYRHEYGHRHEYSARNACILQYKVLFTIPIV
jgi:hypothetical protein